MTENSVIIWKELGEGAWLFSLLIASLGLKAVGVVDRSLAKLNFSPDSPGSRDESSDSADKFWVPESYARLI